MRLSIKWEFVVLPQIKLALTLELPTDIPFINTCEIFHFEIALQFFPCLIFYSSFSSEFEMR